MRRIEPYSLWLGTVVDAWDLRGVLSHGIEAIVDLASNEAPIGITRDVIYYRFPIVDGGANSQATLRFAIDTVVSLLQADVPTLVFCSAGMSRTPAIAAAAISRVSGLAYPECLAQITAGHAHDVAPGLIVDVQNALR